MADLAAAPILSGTSEFDKVEVVIPEVEKTLNQLSIDFHIPLVAQKLGDEGYKIAALQFPDDLLVFSSQIAQILQGLVGSSCEVFILADTSYSPCCVDEVAAQHIKADVIVHFGNTCMNKVRSTPVIYVFDSAEGHDIEKLAGAFNSTYTDNNTRVLLLADSQYSSCVEPLFDLLKKQYINVVTTHLTDPHDPLATFIPNDVISTFSQNGQIPYRSYEDLPADLSAYDVFYLTNTAPSSSLLLYLSTKVSSISLVDMNTYTISSPRPNLRKRYRYMNIARSAATIGILVNTLSIKDVDMVLQKVQHAIQGASKKHYTFVVGKPNVPKLANFDVVDIWVVLGCPLGGIIVDSDEYYKPIITPYELMMALKSEITWDGQWPIDFEGILDARWDDELDGGQAEVPGHESDAPAFDPVTGTYISTSKPLRRVEHINIETEETAIPANDKSLTSRFAGQLSIRGTTSTAAEYLHQQSTWKGLGTDFIDDGTDEDGAELEYGREGTARGYQVRGSNRT